MKIWKDFRFEAAHFLPKVPDGHKCKRLHGHSFRVRVYSYARAPDPVYGWVRDFADISAAMKPILERLDHYCLNDVAGLENPTSENIAIWIYSELMSASVNPNIARDGVLGSGFVPFRVRVSETCNTGAEYP